MTQLFQAVRQLEAEVRSLKAKMQAISAGGLVRATSIIGALPPGSGGTGSTAGALAVFPTFVNDSGGSLAEGTVVVLDSAGGREIATTTTAGHRLVLGVVSGADAPYAVAAETPVLMAGYHDAVLVTGAVVIGDYLRTSTTAGRADSVGTDPQAGVFAIALSAAAGPGNGTVEAFIFAAGSMTRLLEQVTAKGDLLAGAAAGDLDRLAISGNDGYVLKEDSAQSTGLGWEAIGSNTETITSTWTFDDLIAVFFAMTPSDLTISGGAITVTRSHHRVDTQSGAGTDDLDTINGGSSGRLLILRAVDATRTVVIKHGTGNISCQGTTDITLDDASDWAWLLYDAATSTWYATMGAGGGATVNQLLYASTADGSVTNTAVETTLIGSGVGSLTLPANYLTAGRAIRISARGYYSTQTPTPTTLNLRVKFGSTTIVATGDQTPAANMSSREWRIEAVIVCRTTGATGTVIGQAFFEFMEAAQGNPKFWEMLTTSTITVDTTGTLAVDVTADWGAGVAAADSIVCTNFVLEDLSAASASVGNAPTDYPYAGFGTAPGLSAEVDLTVAQLCNEVMNFPSLEGADGTQPEWWEEADANATLTEEDVAGEGITETYERAHKVVVAVANSYAYQRYTYADQPRIKSGRKLSVIYAVWSVGGATARIRLQSSVGSLGASSATTAAAWTILTVDGVTLDGTYVEIREEVDIGTAYFVPLGIMVGDRAIPLRPRGLRFRHRDFGGDHDFDFTTDSGGFVDADVTSFTSPLAALVQMSGFIVTTDGSANIQYQLFVRRNGSSAAASESNQVMSTRTNTSAGRDSARSESVFIMVLDDQQIFEYDFNIAESATSADGSSGMSVLSWWEWE